MQKPTIKVFNLPTVENFPKREFQELRDWLFRLAKNIPEFKVENPKDVIRILIRGENTLEENVLIEISNVDCDLETRKRFTLTIKDITEKLLPLKTDVHVKFIKYDSADIMV